MSKINFVDNHSNFRWTPRPICEVFVAKYCEICEISLTPLVASRDYLRGNGLRSWHHLLHGPPPRPHHRSAVAIYHFYENRPDSRELVKT